jgi:L-threonylcarbamoyladenylate synthase
MIGNNLELAAELLSKGELVAIPTETVYGLAANALNPEAALRIFEAKERPAFDPLIVHIPSVESMELYALEIPELARKLATI